MGIIGLSEKETLSNHKPGDLVHIVREEDSRYALCGADVSNALWWYPGLQEPDCLECDFKDRMMMGEM